MPEMDVGSVGASCF